ncbi:MAG: alcohol dehydrogenase catalytic domain-containing protein [Abditibacteriota bacterium]|nr:alcohol dehydrogenase catalytic domain-containing protein [Abditibacteriota bacterium]
MKSAKLTAIREVKIFDEPMPVIKSDTDVLIKVKAVGICGSDVHYYSDGMIGSQVVQFPFTVGHEGAGVVEAVGSAVTRVKPGDRIAIEPAMPCFECDQCRAGRRNTCRKLRFLGCPGQAEGCLSEYIVMPETSCFPIPDTMNFDEASISEPMAIGWYAVKRSIPMKGKKIAILGAGPVGLCVLLSALDAGAEAIYVTDRLDYRLEMAMAMGAVWGANPDRTDITKGILEAAPEGMDCVFECCGQQSAMDQAVDMLKPGGRLMLIGIPATSERVSFKIDLMRRKELDVRNVRRQNECCQEALDFIASGRVNVNPMVTHRFPLEETGRAMDLVENYSDGVVKAMIDFD